MARTPVTIRRATAADVDALVRLLAELFSIEADFRPDVARQRRGLALLFAAPAEKLVLVAEREAAERDRPPAVVGMVSVQLVVSTAEGGLSGLVEDMVVAAGERGRGTGRLLLVRAEAWARARGTTRLQLLADRENPPALRFYERLGWRGTRLVCLRRGGS
jgi:ribosomal protein S18 acetylase RimI-like enzyme